MKSLNFFSQKKIIYRHVIYISFLIILFSYVWRFLFKEIIRGGGFIYLTNYVQEDWWQRQPLTLGGIGNSAIVSSAISLKFFGTNMISYFLLEFFVMLLIGIFFYILVRLITKNNLVAFAASLIFSVNYFGNYDMIIACYCYLGERIIVVPFLLASLIFLYLFLEKSKKKFYIISLLFYFLGVGLGHFSVLFTSSFLFLPFFWYIYNHKKVERIKGIIKGTLIGLSYVGLTGFFIFIQQITQPGFTEGKLSILEYTLHPQVYHYPEYMLRQLVYWSQYPILIISFLSAKVELQNVLNVRNAIEITPFIAAVYLFASIYIYKKLPKFRFLLFSVILAVNGIFFINPWFGQYDIKNDAGASRYLYFPAFLLSIFWSLFLWAAFWTKKSLRILIGIFILTTYYIINFTLVRDAFISRQAVNGPTKAIINYFANMRKNLSKNTLVVGTYPAITTYEATFYTEQIGKGEVMFLSESDPYTDWKKIASSSSHVIRLTYDKKCNCVKEEKLK